MDEKEWIRRFDVTIGCHDDAEICELVGTFIFDKIGPIMQEQNNIWLDRDDSLGILRNLSRPNIERKKKDIIKTFKSFGLSITVTTNVTSDSYLDVNFDLTKDIYKPYGKPNDEPVYINRHSNHPPNIVGQIPLSLSSRNSNVSLNESIQSC